MDNYLSFRWPAGMAARPEPEHGKKKKQKKRKGRRVWRDILIVCLALIVLCGLVAGSFFGVQYVAERYTAGTPDLPELPNLPGLPDDFITIFPGEDWSEEDWSADLLPKAQPDPSIQLELRTRGESPILSANEIYQQVLPSVVGVQAYGTTGYSSGSGVVVSQSGYIITNYHVIEDSFSLAVITQPDRVTYEAALVGYDKELDLAILKAEGGEFIPAVLGDSDELAVGDAVYAIGNPLGYLYGTMTDGIVSALSDRISQLDYPGRLIQTSAALNSGNSGGALVDAYGRVVGITNAKVSGIRNDVVLEGLGLAIPLTDARPYLNRMFRTGSSARPSLGIQCYSSVEVDGVVGIQVAEATPGTPAEGVLLPDDLIIAANGTRVYAVDDLSRILGELDPGDQVVLTLIRQGEEMKVAVTLYDRLPELQ